MMSERELDDGGAALAAVAGAPVSAHNEAKVRAMLLKAAHDMLSRYPTTLWEDKQTVLEFAEAGWELVVRLETLILALQLEDVRPV